MAESEQPPPRCPECGAEMVLRTARRGKNAGNQFWGCPKYPKCRGTRSVGGEDGRSDGRQARPSPDCPDCGDSMELRTARRGKHEGTQFWGCQNYPDCTGTRSMEGEDAPTERTGFPRPTKRRAVTWRDGTLSRPGWTCRYTMISGSLRAFGGSVEKASSVSQAWMAVSERAVPDPPGPSPFTRVVRKILQRGSAPPIHPASEQLLLEELGLSDRVRPSALPGDLGLESDGSFAMPGEESLGTRKTAHFSPSNNLEFDSHEEEAFFLEWVPANLGASVGRWIIPQASLDLLLRAHDQPAEGVRRVDFLVRMPGHDPFIVEIDGAQHDDAPRVDEDRDQRLNRIGLPVHRIPADEVRAGRGPGLETLRRRFTRAAEASDRPVGEKLLLLPAHLHRLVLALTEGVERGFLTGDRWVVEVHDDVGNILPFVSPYLDLFLALDTIWNAEMMPPEVVLGDGEGWGIYKRSDSGYQNVAKIKGPAGEGDVQLRVRLEAHRTGADRLPQSDQGTPEIVIRSALIPVDLAVAESIGPVRTLPELPHGEDGDRALRGILRAVFAKEEFREGQVAAIRHVLSGHDCAVLLPTGAGKSLVYQLAGLCAPGVTLVVDPIVSLMEDQLETLRSFGVERAIAISSHAVRQGLRNILLDSVASGEAAFVFIAPERLQQRKFREAVRTAAQGSPINLAVIDEAHCVSEWGHDFRTSYLNLGRILRNVGRDGHGSSPAVLALTGTASRAILNDMLVELDIDPGVPGTVIKPETFDRPELKFEVVRVEPSEALPTLRGKLGALSACFYEDKANFFRVRGRRTKSGIVFCPHVNGKYGVIEVAEELTRTTGVPAVTYAGSSPKGISDRDWEYRKRENANAFRVNEAPLLVSTKAFGMGIDKPNIRYVIHYGMPGSIEAYYQEAGRAGRDRQRAECILVLIEFEEERARRLLSEEASLAEMREEREEIPWSAADDISRQLFFHLNSFPGIEEEMESLRDVLEDLGEIGRRRQQEVVFTKGDDGREERERALHRLVILGVVRDYLVDWGARKFDAKLERIEPDEVVDNALGYVRRTQPGRFQTEAERLEPLRSVGLRDAVLKVSEELIRFIYETIERSRRRSLREMWLAARESAENPNVEFRQRILDYLTEGELVPRLEALIDLDEFAFADWLPFLDEIANAEEAREVRGSVARLLASYPDHPGLLASRAWSEVEMPNGDLQEFNSNLHDAIESALARYGTYKGDLDEFGGWLLDRCDSLSVDRGVATAAIGLLDRYGISMDRVRELEGEALRGESSDPGLRVLALTRALEEVNEMLDQLTDFGSGES